jgi:hypothetical protein
MTEDAYYAQLRFQPAGKCIYCGATAYAADEPERGLAEEHIIPLALDGAFHLPEASCRSCERTINEEVEQPLLRREFLPFRTIYGLRSRRKNPPTTTHTIIDPHAGDAKVHVPIMEYPIHLFMPEFPLPGILDGRDPKADVDPPMWSLEPVVRPEKPEQLTGNAFSLEFRTPTFLRLLAKIAHSHLAGEIGIDNFEPLLTDLILGKEPASLHLIGGTSEDHPKGPPFNKLTLAEMPIAGVLHAMIGIRLFGTYGAPEYFVIAGKIKGDRLVQIPPKEEYLAQSLLVH